ncbi:MAG TPA: hypothetical protein PLA54_07605 [Spirochaetota bacterium]|nr:hypothetical protein [Spirochaetota bacterium]HQE59040.1 hypothetical protein [Spirochaetota bacterium]
MAKMTAKKMGTTLLVEASGELSISYAPKAYKFFKSVVQEDYIACYLDLHNIEGIDLSFIELLLSFKRTMVSVGKTFIITKLPDEHVFAGSLSEIGIDQQIFQRGDYGI